MLITGFAAGMFATNCYVVAEQPGSEAVIIDPGQDSAAQVRSILAEHSLTPVAVLLTHGHLDHTWDAADLCDEYSIPAYIHPEDRPMLADPASGIGPALGSVIGGMVFREPEKVIDFVDGEDVELAGIDFDVVAAPGHSRGSVLLTVDVPTEGATLPVCFSGDVLFAGSIGRTDLPGGDHEQLLRSIATTLLRRTDDTQVLPGHGPQTTVGQERTTNPFLVGLPGVSDAAADSPTKGRHGL
ncbi:MBL fold metallo-hydrolase [Williamsia maris]|uniref:Glyoxylase, beta-lactamase superfamily II n=1 Tax=Williamsia maris TaxID=72806 RepID=A0ABT1HKC7_9NOCA|nr:MBL fold metallo-hydrolase [Williamsia maris]MCP2178389.1 Glyoxylase, beta-lactamase superfamily II [Williamsia maris]